ncbi:HAD-IA family hydrolase [Streptomyces avicenniae]|uniref:HAD-IA family hydrolase n=1 Tax=Streptomyces avicenniae TaxID=500153 RepID=UPI0021D7C989|nr:HAD-IA family hydrolase [Streptomyces avicenniae]
MDGTLVDTERLWWQATEEVAARLGHRLTDADLPDVLGRAVEHTAAHLCRAAAADVPPDAVAGRLHRAFADRLADGVPPRPGATELLDRLRAHGVPVGLVSASPRPIVETVLRVLGRDRFAVTISADDTEHAKPASDPYLAAARALGVPPAACVAVEDTPTGVASAEAAGCPVLAVPSAVPIPSAPGRVVRASLADVGLPLLRGLAATGAAPAPPELRVLSWNLWFGGTRVDDHHAKQLRVLRETRADIVGIQENAGAAADLAAALGWHHHTVGRNLAILSRHPLVARYGTPEPSGYGGIGVRVDLGGGRAVVVWTAHLNPEPYGPYDALLDGRPAADLPVREAESGRVRQMRGLLAAMEGHLAAADVTPVILTGDLNAPSHLDWTAAAAPARGGRGPVAWPVSRAAEAAGLRDAYRTVHPDPVAAPGATWSPVRPAHPDGSGRAEPQDRIDYVLYAGSGLRVTSARTHVTGAPRPYPDVRGNAWPSDHAAVLATFLMR